jgi:hypothetical protein
MNMPKKIMAPRGDMFRLPRPILNEGMLTSPVKKTMGGFINIIGWMIN